MIRRRNALAFSSEEEFKQTMIDYLDSIDKQNRGKEIYQCTNCYKKFELDAEEKLCCENQNLVHVYTEVPQCDRLRPSYFGFCAYAGISKTTLQNYNIRYPEVYQWFLSILQADLEQILLNPGTRNVGGAKFVAVNNFGWKDKTDVEHTGSQPVTFVNNIPEDDTNDS